MGALRQLFACTGRISGASVRTHAIDSQNHRGTAEGSCLPPGSPVRVPKIGEGKVVSVADGKVTIVFPDSRKRTFLRDYVKRV